MMPLITILCVYVCVKGGGGGRGVVQTILTTYTCTYHDFTFEIMI